MHACRRAASGKWALGSSWATRVGQGLAKRRAGEIPAATPKKMQKRLSWYPSLKWCSNTQQDWCLKNLPEHVREILPQRIWKRPLNTFEDLTLLKPMFFLQGKEKVMMKMKLNISNHTCFQDHLISLRRPSLFECIFDEIKKIWTLYTSTRLAPVGIGCHINAPYQVYIYHICSPIPDIYP